jgi:hypothetical protein
MTTQGREQSRRIRGLQPTVFIPDTVSPVSETTVNAQQTLQTNDNPNDDNPGTTTTPSVTTIPDAQPGIHQFFNDTRTINPSPQLHHSTSNGDSSTSTRIANTHSSASSVYVDPSQPNFNYGYTPTPPAYPPPPFDPFTGTSHHFGPTASPQFNQMPMSAPPTHNT